MEGGSLSASRRKSCRSVAAVFGWAAVPPSANSRIASPVPTECTIATFSGLGAMPTFPSIWAMAARMPTTRPSNRARAAGSVSAASTKDTRTRVFSDRDNVLGERANEGLHAVVGGGDRGLDSGALALGGALEHGVHEVGARREIIGEMALRDAGRLGNTRLGQLGKPALADQRDGRHQKLLADVGRDHAEFFDGFVSITTTILGQFSKP